MTQMSNFYLEQNNYFFEMHKLLPGLLPRLHQVCGKMFFSTTGGIVMENVVLHKIILYLYFILFYSIFSFVMLSLKMLGVIILVRS